MEDSGEEVEGIEEIVEDSLSDDLSYEDEEEASEDGSQFEAIYFCHLIWDTFVQAPLTEAEIEELIAELLEVESKAAEAQEALEKESLEKVERDEQLDGASTVLKREQLDGAGIDLPSIYKWIESQAPNGCCTEAWKKRTHWVGSEITSDAVESIKDAEKHLQTLRPVRSKNGKILEEGASGYLGKRVAGNDSGKGSAENGEVDWSSFNKLFSHHPSTEGISFGSQQWASVYLASTPQQAAAMGIKFPGVDEPSPLPPKEQVEEIDEVDDDASDPFIADAIANERELVLSEAQRKNYKKVREEDDVRVDRKRHLRLKQRMQKQRNRKNSNQDTEWPPIAWVGNEGCQPAVSKGWRIGKESSTGPPSTLVSWVNVGLGSSLEVIVAGNLWKAMGKSLDVDWVTEYNIQTSAENCGPAERLTGEGVKAKSLDACEWPVDAVKEENNCSGGSSELSIPQSTEPSQGSKHSRDDEEVDNDAKRIRTCISDSDGEAQTLADNPDSIDCDDAVLLNQCSSQENGHEYIHAKFHCTACGKVTDDVHQHPLLKVIICGECKCAFEAKMTVKELTMELEKALGSKESTSSSSDSDTDDSDEDIGVSISSKKTKSKKIRRILDDTELGEETKRKIAMEKERQERLKSLKAQFSGMSMMVNSSTYNGSLPEGASSEVLGDASNGYIVNVVREKGEDAVRIPPSISAKLKTHQVIAFLYTAMRSVDLGLKTALVVAPVNVLHNWRQEFKKWEPTEFKPLRVYMLEDRPRDQRAELLTKWRTKGGVFLIGYTAFRNLSLGKRVKDRQTAREICSALQEGPDILVCDEAHIIKNTRADTTQALKQVRCQRRIALTGSPLQNNLMEYYCVSDLVLTCKFLHLRCRFQNPIENGQHANSTAEDVRIMNQRSHILYEQLKGFVQRMDMSVVKKDLPPKTVFVIAVKLSSLQRKLYKKFLDVHGFSSYKASCDGITKKCFFAGYQVLAQICNHPWILQLMKERNAKSDDTVEKFLPDASSSDENPDSNMMTGGTHGWWNDLLNQDNHHIDYSGKMVLLLDILTACTEIGDKALVFSQSIPTLDVIEYYLSKLPRQGKKGKRWKRGKDWYRIDGKTEGSERQRLVDAFNNPQNRRVKCTLISTRAGALGINLFAANRVIIVDGSWNPTYDLQAIYRAWRYGQKKPVYAYRLVAHGTMEEKIYKRQVQKEGLAARVVDRQQVHRSMSKEEILHIFDFSDDESMADKNGHANHTNISRKVGNLLKQASSDCPGSCCSDKLMDILLVRHHQRWIMNYHEHETLLQENEEEKLTKEEQDLAWEVFRRSMEWQEVQRVPADESTFEQEQIVKPPPVAPLKDSIPEPVINVRSRVPLRKCTNISHLLTLRSQGIKIGCSTVCGECALEISWEELNKDTKLKE
ncbi:hypothetical protein Cgig2_024895 [Carnegiea gigantea]|uniref:Transcriptional regulator ATRX n=1 Tax=Carnegiea gigantea TaxID=171969 RepID=A0A9Q1QGZ4_9CARY|nr:hypothetical protein Cgig2_024895 [Carnegiea gigantea]